METKKQFEIILRYLATAIFLLLFDVETVIALWVPMLSVVLEVWMESVE